MARQGEKWASIPETIGTLDSDKIDSLELHSDLNSSETIKSTWRNTLAVANREINKQLLASQTDNCFELDESLFEDVNNFFSSKVLIKEYNKNELSQFAIAKGGRSIKNINDSMCILFETPSVNIIIQPPTNLQTVKLPFVFRLGLPPMGILPSVTLEPPHHF